MTLNIENGNPMNCEFLILDENKNIVDGLASFESLIYFFITGQNKLPSTLKYETATAQTELDFTLNNKQTNFKDMPVTGMVQGYLTLDSYQYTIVIYNIDWSDESVIPSE